MFAFLPMFASAHGLGPAKQSVKVYNNPNIMFKVSASNQRKDVTDYFITVQDSQNLRPVKFSSTDRVFNLPYQFSKDLTIFVRNEGVQNYRVCTWAKTKDTATTVVSGVCSSVSVAYQ